MEKQKSLGEQVQEAVSNSGKSIYQIAKEANLQQSTLQRVMNEGWGKQFDTAEKILQTLGKKIKIL